MLNWKERLELAEKEEHQGKEGVPSFSAAPQLSLCPGAFHAKRNLEDISGEPAIKGSACHTLLKEALQLKLDKSFLLVVDALKEIIPIDIPEDTFDDLLDMSRKLDVLLLEGWEVVGIEKYCELIEDNEVLWTGTCDLILKKFNEDIRCDELLFPDYKSGWIWVSPKDNMQLNGYAVAGSADLKHDIVYVTIFQPNRPVDFIKIEVEEERKKFIDLAYKVEEGIRTPSMYACQYCTANGMPGHCCETIDIIFNLKKLNDITKEDFDNMNPEEICEYLDTLPIVEKGIKNFKDWSKKRISEKNDIPKWYLQQGARKFKIKDLDKAREQLKGIIDLSKMPFEPAKVKEQLIKAGKASQKTAQEELEKILGDNLEFTRNASSLKREKQ